MREAPGVQHEGKQGVAANVFDEQLGCMTGLGEGGPGTRPCIGALAAQDAVENRLSVGVQRLGVGPCAPVRRHHAFGLVKRLPKARHSGQFGQQRHEPCAAPSWGAENLQGVLGWEGGTPQELGRRTGFEDLSKRHAVKVREVYL